MKLTTECFARSGQPCEGYLTRPCRYCGRTITLELLRAQKHLREIDKNALRATIARASAEVRTWPEWKRSDDVKKALQELRAKDPKVKELGPCIFCGKQVTDKNFQLIRQVVYAGTEPLGESHVIRRSPGEDQLLFHSTCGLPPEMEPDACDEEAEA